MECIKAPPVIGCEVIQCAYNIDRKCHTPAITVGSRCPKCESYIKGLDKGGVPGASGSVGSCHKSDCTYNRSLECNAPNGISVGDHLWHADCKTYAKR